MLRLRQMIEERAKKSAEIAASSNSSPITTCEDVGRPDDTMDATEGVKPCKICKRPVTTRHECSSQAIVRWLAIKNARSRRIRNMKRRTNKLRVVSKKSRFARYRHHGNRNSTVRKRPMHQRSTCTKPRGRDIRISPRETKHKYALVKSSTPTIHIRRGIRNTLIHKRVARKRPTSNKKNIQSNQKTSRRPIQKQSARRGCVSSRPIGRKSSSHKSLVRAGHRVRAPKRSETLGTSKSHSSRRTMPTIGHLPRMSRSCPACQ